MNADIYNNSNNKRKWKNIYAKYCNKTTKKYMANLAKEKKNVKLKYMCLCMFYIRFQNFGAISPCGKI